MVGTVIEVSAVDVPINQLYVRSPSQRIHSLTEYIKAIHTVTFICSVSVSNVIPMYALVLMMLVAILCYDHLITFGEEYRRIWIHPLTGASLRFLLTRYFALIAVSIVNCISSWSTGTNPGLF